MKNDAFISYSKTDKKTADAICKALEAADLKCWYAPRNIPSGEDWDACIMEALASSRVMVLVWSAQSDKSKQVKREVSIALDDVGITLIPFRVETIVASKLRYYLGNIQWLDAEASIEESLQHLVIQVKDAIQQAAPPADVPEAQLAGSAAIGEQEGMQAAELTEAEARQHEEAETRKREETEARERAEAEMREREERAARWRAEAETRKREEAEAREREAAMAREREAVAARERAETEAREREEAEARKREELAARERAEAEARKAALLAGQVGAADSKPELKPFASPSPAPAQVTPPTHGALENRAAAYAVPAVDSYSPTALQKLGTNRVAIAGVAIAAVALLVVVAGLAYAFWPSQPGEQLVATNETTPTPEAPTSSPYVTVENFAGPSPAGPSPSPRKSPSPGRSESETTAPTPEPTPPLATTTPGKAPAWVGDLTGKGIRMSQPAYPPKAKAARASGAVDVEVTIDEYGNVISAKAISGHPLLQGAAVQAARASRFAPTKLSGQPVKVTGVIIYNFVEPAQTYPMQKKN